MASTDQKGDGHGEIEILAAPLPIREQRPLTSAEKIAATKIEVRPSPSSTASQASRREDAAEIPAEKTQSKLDYPEKLSAWQTRLNRKFGIENCAVERKFPEDRLPATWRAQLDMAFLWASATLNLPLFAAGFVGQELGLSLAQSLCISIFATLLGALITGFCATMGPAMGLRQMSISRYSMGWWPNKLVVLLNAIQKVAWGANACLTGGIALQAVSEGNVPAAAGVVIIAVVSLVVATLGLSAILAYQRYLWLVFLVIFLVIYGETGGYASPASRPQVHGAPLGGAILNLFAIYYGASASLATIASDYYVHYPVNMSRTKTFALTTIGIAIPSSLCLGAGCVVSSAFYSRPDWLDTYTTQGLGHLIVTMIHPTDFAKLLLVVLVLSGINSNVLSMYSTALSLQQLSRSFTRIPHPIWTLLSFAAIIAVSLAGHMSLLNHLQDLFLLLGYWSTSYFVITFSEHYVFRGNSFWNYDLEAWDDPSRLPHGFAAATAFGLGVVAWVMGMVGIWFTGPLARVIGSSGGNVAPQFTLLVTAMAYIPLRYWERAWSGR